MRKEFQAFIPPDDAIFKELWASARVVLDTNVVLNLYRFSDATRDEFLAVLESLKDRLWMPHQVGWEFFRRRSAAMTDNERDVLVALRKAKAAFEDSAAGLRGRQASTHHLDDIAQAIEEKINEVEKARDERLRLYTEAGEPVLERILDLYDGRVGGEPEEDWLKKHFALGEARYRAKTPPGYCDAKDKKGHEPRSLYGDYLLWREVIDHATAGDADIILVTNDGKEDWVEEVSGKKLGPRRELMDEFTKLTGRRCWVYTVRAFLHHAGAFIEAQVSEDAMSEVDVLARVPRMTVGIDFNDLLQGARVTEETLRRIREMQSALPLVDQEVMKQVAAMRHALDSMKIDPEILKAASAAHAALTSFQVDPEMLRSIAATQAAFDAIRIPRLPEDLLRDVATLREQQAQLHVVPRLRDDVSEDGDEPDEGDEGDRT